MKSVSTTTCVLRRFDFGWSRFLHAPCSLLLASAICLVAATQNSFAGSRGYDITSSASSITLTLTGTDNSVGSPGSETSNASADAIRAENTSGTNTIDAPIVLGAGAGVTQYFYQARGGTLVINGVIS